MMISNEQIEKMLADAAKATPGTWYTWHTSVCSVYFKNGVEWKKHISTVYCEDWLDNATHIANCAPQTIIALCDEIQRLRAKENG